MGMQRKTRRRGEEWGSSDRAELAGSSGVFARAVDACLVLLMLQYGFNVAFVGLMPEVDVPAGQLFQLNRTAHRQLLPTKHTVR